MRERANLLHVTRVSKTPLCVTRSSGCESIQNTPLTYRESSTPWLVRYMLDNTE